MSLAYSSLNKDCKQGNSYRLLLIFFKNLPVSTLNLHIRSCLFILYKKSCITTGSFLCTLLWWSFWSRGNKVETTLKSRTSSDQRNPSFSPLSPPPPLSPAAPSVRISCRLNVDIFFRPEDADQNIHRVLIISAQEMETLHTSLVLHTLSSVFY